MNVKDIFNETNKEIFLEIETHLLFDEKPSIFLNDLVKEDYIKNTLFNILLDLKDIPQNPKFHPEGDVWTHTLCVVDEAAKHKFSANNIKAFMWAALLHDIGKIKTTLINKKGEISDTNHHRVGAEMASRIFREYSFDDTLRHDVVSLIKHHTAHFYVLKRISGGNIKNMIDTANINDVALLSLCDSLGVGPISTDVKNATLSAINSFIDIMSEKTGTLLNKLDITF